MLQRCDGVFFKVQGKSAGVRSLQFSIEWKSLFHKQRNLVQRTKKEHSQLISKINGASFMKISGCDIKKYTKLQISRSPDLNFTHSTKYSINYKDYQQRLYLSTQNFGNKQKSDIFVFTVDWIGGTKIVWRFSVFNFLGELSIFVVYKIFTFDNFPEGLSCIVISSCPLQRYMRSYAHRLALKFKQNSGLPKAAVQVRRSGVPFRCRQNQRSLEFFDTINAASLALT